MNEAREIQQIAVVTNAFLNVTPSEANRSMCGVLTNGCPEKPRQSARKSSASSTIKFGRLGSAAFNKFANSPPANNASDAPPTSKCRHTRTPPMCYTHPVAEFVRIPPSFAWGQLSNWPKEDQPSAKEDLKEGHKEGQAKRPYSSRIVQRRSRCPKKVNAQLVSTVKNSSAVAFCIT